MCNTPTHTHTGTHTLCRQTGQLSNCHSKQIQIENVGKAAQKAEKRNWNTHTHIYTYLSMCCVVSENEKQKQENITEVGVARRWEYPGKKLLWSLEKKLKMN